MLGLVRKMLHFEIYFLIIFYELISAQVLSNMVKRQLVLLSSSQVHGYQLMEQPKPHLIEFFEKYVSV